MTVHYVPAGLESFNRTTILYRKHASNASNKTHFGRQYKKWWNEEAVLQLSHDSHEPLHDADLLAPTLGPEALRLMGVTLGLSNPHNGKPDCHLHKKFGVSMILDSGGFQLATSTQEFLNPDDVIKSYSEGAAIGMPLDLPVPATLERRFFDAASKLIKANDAYFLPRMEPTTTLALISHGSTLDLRKRRLDTIDRVSPVVAIGGLQQSLSTPGSSQPRLVTHAQNLLYVIFRYRKTTEYFHVLGVTGVFWMFIYALLSESKIVKRIGGDSVTYLLLGATGLYPTVDFKNMRLPDVVRYRVPLSCPCPTCQTVQDSRILAREGNLMSSHILWVFNHRVSYLEYLAGSFLRGEISAREVFATLVLQGTPEQYSTLKYVVNTIEKDKFIPLPAPTIRSSSGLFGNAGAREDTVKVERFTRILQNYEKFHGMSFL